jgi:hypothetical protein
MISEFIQQHIHKCGRRKIFSASQEGVVMGIQGCMEHTVLTREMIAHAKRHKKNHFMVQIDVSNAFGSVPQKTIDWNMRRMGIPDVIVDPVMNIYDGCETVIVTNAGPSNPIPWTSGTVQGCPLSPVLFNICLEPLLRALNLPEFTKWGFPIEIQEEGKPDEVLRVNTAAYADDLIPYSEFGDGINEYLKLLAKYCNYAGMKVNVKKCVSLIIKCFPTLPSTRLSRLPVQSPSPSCSTAPSYVQSLSGFPPSEISPPVHIERAAQKVLSAYPLPLRTSLASLSSLPSADTSICPSTNRLTGNQSRGPPKPPAIL